MTRRVHPKETTHPMPSPLTNWWEHLRTYLLLLSVFTRDSRIIPSGSKLQPYWFTVSASRLFWLQPQPLDSKVSICLYNPGKLLIHFFRDHTVTILRTLCRKIPSISELPRDLGFIVLALHTLSETKKEKDGTFKTTYNHKGSRDRSQNKRRVGLVNTLSSLFHLSTITTPSKLLDLDHPLHPRGEYHYDSTPLVSFSSWPFPRSNHSASSLRRNHHSWLSNL